MSQLQILVADYHEIVRKGLVSLISLNRPAWEVCGERRTVSSRGACETVETRHRRRPGLWHAHARQRIGGDPPYFCLRILRTRFLILTITDRMKQGARFSMQLPLLFC